MSQDSSAASWRERSSVARESMGEQERFADGIDAALQSDLVRASWLAEEARTLGTEREMRAVSDLMARQEALREQIARARRSDSTGMAPRIDGLYRTCRDELHALEARIVALKHTSIDNMSADLDRARTNLAMMHSRTSRLWPEGKADFHTAMTRLESELERSGRSIAAFAETPDDHWAEAKERFDRDWNAIQREIEAYAVALGMVARTALGATPVGLFDNWWVVALRGVLGLTLSAVVLSQSATMALSFNTVVGVYALINGALQIVEAMAAGARSEHWQALLAAGIVGVVVGVLALATPVTIGISMVFIAAWAVAQGVLEAVAARRLRVHVQDEWILATHGAAWIVFGLLTASIPMTRITALLVLFGAFLFASGLLLISLGLRMWTIRRRVGGASESPLAEPA